MPARNGVRTREIHIYVTNREAEEKYGNRGRGRGEGETERKPTRERQYDEIPSTLVASARIHAQGKILEMAIGHCGP